MTRSSSRIWSPLSALARTTIAAPDETAVRVSSRPDTSIGVTRTAGSTP